MKTIKIDVRHVLILLASLAFFSCSKDPEVGPTGPQGPQGEQGIQGPEGPQGPSGQDGADGQDGQDGADGEDGNANVIVSDWIATEFITNATNFTFFEVDALGTNTNGAFLVYGKRIEVADGGGEFIYQMPHVWFNERYTYRIEPGEVNFPTTITPNKIRFTARSVDGTQETFNYFEEVRYVNIPQSISEKSTIDFNKMAYEEVMDHFGLSY